MVIANPPYVRQEGIKDLKPALKGESRAFFCGTADIYTYFYKRGTDLLKTGGHLCFIAPNKFMRAGYGKNTRELLTEKVSLKTVIDFCDLPIFDATTYPSILFVEKRPPAERKQRWPPHLPMPRNLSGLRRPSAQWASPCPSPRSEKMAGPWSGPRCSGSWKSSRRRQTAR